MNFWHPNPFQRQSLGGPLPPQPYQPPGMGMGGGPSMGGNLPPQLMQPPGMQTGGNDPAQQAPGMQTGGQLPPQAQGYGYGLARMGMNRPEGGTFAMQGNRLAGRGLVR